MAPIDENRIELLFELMRKPIPWDPLPPWLKLDERMLQKFTQLEVQYRAKEMELQKQKLADFGNIVGVKLG